MYTIYRRIRMFIINCQIITSTFHITKPNNNNSWIQQRVKIQNLNYIFPVQQTITEILHWKLSYLLGLVVIAIPILRWVLCYVCHPNSITNVDMHNRTVAWWWWQINISDICFIYHFAIKWKLLTWLCSYINVYIYNACIAYVGWML